MAEDADIWNSEAEAELLAARAEGFWNLDYFERIVLPLLNLSPGATVLDVGAGNGALTFLLARLRADLSLTGLDQTAALVDAGSAEAQKRGLANVRFVEGNALDLAFEDGTFDAVVCQTLLIHVPDAARVVREMARVLKPGGTFFAAEFHILNLEGPLEAGGPSGETLAESAAKASQLVEGYRKSGQGDLRIGARVPFLARDAGLSVAACRINDRVSYGFPPYATSSERTSLNEARSWVGVFSDPGYRAWVEASISAAGGSAQDVDRFLQMIPQSARDRITAGDYPFVWLINPILVLTVGRKPGA